jgi:RNA-directed DNA polymerase
MGKSQKTGKCYPHVQPSKKSLQIIKDRVTGLEEVVRGVNATLRGWVGYFHYRNCSKVLIHLRNHVEQRLIMHLRKRHKVRDRMTGFVKFPRRSLYAKYGLYNVPMTAGWRKVHALP